MHGRAVVPDDQVTHAPGMPVDELALGGVLDQLV